MNEMQRTNNNVSVPENADSGRERDYLKDAGRVFNYLDEHPGVGFIAGGTLTAGGIGALVYYGSKLVRV